MQVFNISNFGDLKPNYNHTDPNFQLFSPDFFEKNNPDKLVISTH
jgi:hypothetical protein